MLDISVMSNVISVMSNVISVMSNAISAMDLHSHAEHVWATAGCVTQRPIHRPGVPATRPRVGEIRRRECLWPRAHLPGVIRKVASYAATGTGATCHTRKTSTCHVYLQYKGDKHLSYEEGTCHTRKGVAPAGC